MNKFYIYYQLYKYNYWAPFINYNIILLLNLMWQTANSVLSIITNTYENTRGVEYLDKKPQT